MAETTTVQVVEDHTVVQVAGEQVTVLRQGEDRTVVVATASVGLRGPAGSISSFHFVQPYPSLVWVVQHNLGYNPGGINAEDSNGNHRTPSISHPSLDVTLLTFSEAISGFADLS